MTNMDFLSVSSPSSYWQTRRAPRYSLSFALPLLLFYHVLAVLLAHGTRSVRNGADVILEGLFVAVAVSCGPLVVLVCLTAAGALVGRASVSAFRGLGPSGDRLHASSGVVRMLAGLFSSALDLAGGFGIAAWPRALCGVSVRRLHGAALAPRPALTGGATSEH